MNSKAILQFLKKLDAHNNKVWFDENREEYLALRRDWLVFVEKLLGHLGEKDSNYFQQAPHKCIFRINRDVRFSRNKSPYKTNFGAYFAPKGKVPGQAGFYVHLEPGNCAIAGGMHYPAKPTLDKIRERLLDDKSELPKIIKNKNFIQYFNDIDRSHSLKRRPNGFDEHHPRIDLIKLKSFTVWKPVSDAQTSQKDFFDVICDHFDAMDDFINWLNE